MFDDWRNDLEAWLKPFVSALGHKTRGLPDHATDIFP